MLSPRATAQGNPIGFSALEIHNYATDLSWFEEKMQIIRETIRFYLNNHIYVEVSGFNRPL